MRGDRAKSPDSQTVAERWDSFEVEALPHAASLFRIAMWLARNRTEAEDLVQETFVEALASFHRFESGTNCRAWLVSILYHRNSKRRRDASRLQLVSETEENIAETVAFEPPTPQGLTDEEVVAALQRLPPMFQEAVILADIEELSYREVAAALKVPIGTVMSRLSRGRKLLRASLAKFANARGFSRSDRANNQ